MSEKSYSLKVVQADVVAVHVNGYSVNLSAAIEQTLIVRAENARKAQVAQVISGMASGLTPMGASVEQLATREVARMLAILTQYVTNNATAVQREALVSSMLDTGS